MKKLNLYCFIDESGHSQYITSYSFEEFLDYMLNEYIDSFEDVKYTKEQMLNYFRECPYIAYYDVNDEDIVEVSKDCLYEDNKYILCQDEDYNTVSIKAKDLLREAKRNLQEIGWD